MSRSFSIILCAFSTLTALGWCFLRYKSFLRFYDIIKAADRSAFVLPSLLGPGFCALVYFPHLSARISRIAASKLGLSEFDCYCALAWAVSAGVSSASVCSALAALAADTAFALCCLMLTVTAAFFPIYILRDKKRKTAAEIEITLPVIISKLALLSETGLPLPEAWNKTAEGGSGYVYEKMKAVSEMMRNGIPIPDAMHFFAEACGTKAARQLCAIVSGKISRGGEGLGSSLRFLHSESWDSRRITAKLKGQAAASALIFPLLLMFIGIIIMIAVPLLSGFDF